jgi:hypothetical protein
VDGRHLSRINKALTRALNADAMMRMARASGFCQRMRTVPPHELAVAVIAAMATRSTETIADVQRMFNGLTDGTVAYKPFHKKLARPSFAVFMREVVAHLLKELMVEALRPVPHGVLRIFNDIWIQDGSSFAVNDALASLFPGRHATISPAAVELHATMSLWSDQPVALAVAADTQGERDFLPPPELLTGTLLIADRGYQSVDYCRDVDRHHGFVLIRHQTTINPAIVQGAVNGKSVRITRSTRLHDLVRRHRGQTLDVDAQWQGIGQPHRPDTRLRVVMYWNPERRDYMALVTNLDRVAFPPHVVYQLYRLRWQIELLFKEWKSYCNLHRFGTTKAPIAEGFMWAGLAACILKRFMAKAAQQVFAVGEVSTRKAVMTIGHHLYALLRAMLTHARHRGALRELLTYLSTQSLRAHPKRDRVKGRLRLGIIPVSA